MIDGRFQQTDVGLCERFTQQHGSRVRYCHSLEKWLVWDGTRWRQDATNEVMRLAKETARSLCLEAGKASNPKDVAAALDFAKSSQKRARLEAMIVLAESELPIPITVDQLDSDPYLLNFTNGTVDLRTGVLRPHDPADLITKSAGIAYADQPGDDPVVWMEFLYTIFGGDVDLVSYMQRLLGLSLIGKQIEHVFPIAHGSGSNGKSVLFNTVMGVLGEYAIVAAPNLFMARKNEAHTTELMDLCGRRIVVLNETQDGGKLNEGLVKAVSGGDNIRARWCHKDSTEFKPSHTAFLITNHKPVVTGSDFGLWRRLQLLPFTVTIPVDQQDRDLPAKLLAEGPAIARWLVQGCLEYQQHGLNPPSTVLAATSEYKTESDSIGSWFDATASLDPYAVTPNAIVFKSYRTFCETEGYEPTTQKAFTAELKRRGFNNARRKQGNVWIGFKL